MSDSPGPIDSPGEGAPRKGRGGRRPGAGRPQGSRNVLPTGAVKAIKSLGLRIPETATPEEAALANRALDRIVAVMDEQVSAFGGGAFAVLTAARAVREEICGPVVKKVAVTGADGGPVVFRIEEN